MALDALLSEFGGDEDAELLQVVVTCGVLNVGDFGEYLLLLAEPDLISVGQVEAEAFVQRVDQFREQFLCWGVLLAATIARAGEEFVATSSRDAPSSSIAA